MNENTVSIPARLKNVSVGGHVAGAEDIDFDKEYDASAFSGMGRVVIPKKIVNGVNTLTHEAFEDSEGNDRENTIYVIQYDFTLGEDITVPANCVLEFDGGSISAGSGANMDTINFNGCGIEAPKENTIFGETLNIKGLQYAHASWLGIVPAAVGSDSGSSKFIHFCSSPNCDGFELEFDRGDYRFAFHGVLLNKYMKLKGATDKSTRWFITIDASCTYVIGVNRHCSVSNLDIRLASRSNQTGVDFFRVSNEWSDDEDAADTMKVNYDYSFDTIWLKGVYESNYDYSSSMNGIAIRLRDKEVGASADNKVLYAEGPQHCNNIMIEMVRAGIVFEVTNTSETGDKVWANGFVFSNLFIQGQIGYESILDFSKTPSSGKNYIIDFQYQGSPTTDGLYGWFNGDFVCNHESHDTFKYGTARGFVYLSNCGFSTSDDNPFTDLVNGFKPYNGVNVLVLTSPYKVNKFRITPTVSSGGVTYHDIDLSVYGKSVWKTRSDKDSYVERILLDNEYSEKIKAENGSYTVKKLSISSCKSLSAINDASYGALRLSDMTEFPTFGLHQDGAVSTGFEKYGFFYKVDRLSNSSFRIGDTLKFTYTLTTSSGSLSNSIVLIKNLFWTGGHIELNQIVNNGTSIVITLFAHVHKSSSLTYDSVGILYKVVDRGLSDETQSLWSKGNITTTLGAPELLRHANGTWDERPTSRLYTGLQYFCTDKQTIEGQQNGIMIYYNGSDWVDALGRTIS